MVQWYYMCITHRNLYIEINRVKLIITTGIGFPQGDILNKHRVFGQVFADDSIAKKVGKNLHQMMSRIQKVVTELEVWGEERWLKFNATKTVVIIFTKCRLKTKDYPNRLLVSNKPVEFSNSVKYFGVTFDSKLLWTEHFNSSTKEM